MADGRSCCSSTEQVYIDTNRIMDSCRDKDCYEDVRVYLTDFGQEIIEQSGSVRAKCASVVGTNISVVPLAFNKGFYQVNIRMYVRCICEACVCAGRPQEIEGLAVVDKSVILYGSEGSVKLFRSDPQTSDFCPASVPDAPCSTNLPVAVLEVVDPVVLSCRIEEKARCRCHCCCDVPSQVLGTLNGNLCQSDDPNRLLVISLGFFSVVRIERPGQYLIHATEYAVPEKECAMIDDDDPCSVFRRMNFPTEQFAPPSLSQNHSRCCAKSG